jgi:uncharacterized membrane protein YkoI
MNRKSKALILAGALALAALAGGAAAAAVFDTGSEADRSSRFAADDDQSDDGPGQAEDESSDAPEEDAAEGPDTPISGPDLQRASQVALAFLGEGRVTETEVGDEESYYEVEITLDDGRQVDVQLDESFHVVGTD